VENRIVLVGAGSAQFGYGTIGDILQSKVLEGSHIVLLDINPEAVSTVGKKAQDFIEEHSLPFTVSATTDREEALEGANFIVNSIEVGNRFDLWEQDWRIPQQFGIRQVYGENGGPGGLFHSLRILPPILEICADVMRICPDAYLINYSNPMSRICTTIHRAFPDLKLIGMCHEIAWIRRLVPTILGVPYEDLEVRAGGLNHFSVVLTAKYRRDGRNAYPDLLEKARTYYSAMPSQWHLGEFYKTHGRYPETQEEVASIPTAPWPERSLFRVMLDTYDLYPITTDSHFGEYIPWAYDVVDHKGILDFFRGYRNWMAKENPQIQLELSEQAIPIMEGILTDSGYLEEAVNIPNNGLIENLPDWMVVEVPAAINKNGVNGMPQGMIPHGFAGLLLNQVAIHDLTAEAVLQKSRRVALQSLLADPIVQQYRRVEEMLDTMISYQEKWLGYLK
jgi:alpha-galactosidase